jgi:hypothetical protein
MQFRAPTLKGLTTDLLSPWKGGGGEGSQRSGM